MAEPRRERKVVTVLFADLVGFTSRAEQLDPEDVDAVLRPYHERLRAELEQWGGTVEKFIGDAVVAVFGAPVAREDDPERALRAALAIRDWAIEEDGVEVRIAVNTGEALVSLDARPDSGEGMIAGDVVNTASRLQSAAPVNGILVGEQTQRATSHVIDYGDCGSGRGEREERADRRLGSAAGALALRRRRPPARRRGARRARIASSNSLVEALARAQQEREPQLVTLVGVPGIGKSRLVWELFGAVGRGDTLVVLAAGPLASARRRRQLLGALRDGQGPGGDPRGRRRGRRRRQARPCGSRRRRGRAGLGGRTSRAARRRRGGVGRREP